MATKPTAASIRNKVKKKKELSNTTQCQIKDHVAREEKAYRIVERLIDNPVSLTFLKKCLKCINQQHYVDIVEERAIEKNCGYPICEKVLPKNIKKQKYTIDTRVNKVFDLTDRKQFCSDKCCSFSRNLKEQLSTEPVWLLSSNSHDDINILIVDKMREKENEEDEEDVPKNIQVSDRHISAEHRKQPKTVSETVEKIKTVSETSEKLIDENKGAFDFSNLTLSDEEAVEVQLPALSSIGQIRQALIEWRTDASDNYLNNNNTENTIEEADLLEDYLLDDDLKVNFSDLITKSIPLITDLDSDKINIRESNMTERCTALPKIDNINQHQQRHNILLTKLQLAFTKLLAPVSLLYSDISHSLVELTSRLDLSPHNVMFSEKQWAMIACVILKCLFLCNVVVVKMFRDLEGLDHFVELSLVTLGLSKGEFDQLYDLFR